MPQQYIVPKRILKAFPSLQGAAARVEYWVFAAAFRLLAILPPATASALAAGLFRRFGPLGDKAIKVRRNLQISFPELSEPELRRQVNATFAHLGRAMAEMAQAPRLWRERETRLELVCDEELRALLQPGSAAVLVTAHVGAWQYTTMVGALLGIELTSLFAAESNPYMRELFFGLRQGLGGKWLSRDSSMRKLMRELSHGHAIGLVTDIRVDEGELLPLFAEDAPTNTVPARLALRYDCPLIAVRCDRLPGLRYRIMLSRHIVPNPTLDDVDAQARHMSLKLNEEFETWIRQYPGEWACMKRRWPKEIDRSAG